MLTSKKINAFFAKNSEIDGFWDLLHEWEIYDEQEWYGDEESRFADGFALADKAKGRSVYTYITGDGGLTLYFIGEEEEILQKLESFLQDMLIKYPPEDESTKHKKKLQKQAEQAQKELSKAQAKLNKLQKQLGETL